MGVSDFKPGDWVRWSKRAIEEEPWPKRYPNGPYQVVDHPRVHSYEHDYVYIRIPGQFDTGGFFPWQLVVDEFYGAAREGAEHEAESKVQGR